MLLPRCFRQPLVGLTVKLIEMKRSLSTGGATSLVMLLRVCQEREPLVVGSEATSRESIYGRVKALGRTLPLPVTL
jgi:hypothetical protein